MLAPMPEQTDPHDILRTSPFAGSLEEALSAHPPRPKLPLLTTFLAVGILAVGGLVGGIHADRHWGGRTPKPGPERPPAASGRGNPLPAGGRAVPRVGAEARVRVPGNRSRAGRGRTQDSSRAPSPR